jgi:hypothetical protein
MSTLTGHGSSISNGPLQALTSTGTACSVQTSAAAAVRESPQGIVSLLLDLIAVLAASAFRGVAVVA